MRYYKFLFICFISIFANLSIDNIAHAYIEVKVTSMNANPMPLVVLKFVTDKQSQWVGDIINNKLGADLKNSGAFAVTPQTAPVEFTCQSKLSTTKALLKLYPDYNALVVGSVIFNNGVYIIKYTVWDTYNNQPVLAKGFRIKNLTQLDAIYTAHYIANNIYKSFLGIEGYFNSKIAFVANKNIYIMDYDGSNTHSVISTANNVYTPVLSNDGKYLAYISLSGGFSEIHLLNLITKINYKLGNFTHMVLAPRFSNDGNSLLFALSRSGNTNIFKVNITDSKVTQLTYSYSINIPGSFSPDDKYIVFTSDRQGVPQLYLMNNDGSGIKRISNLKGAYYTPKWSPRGDLIAFTKVMKGGIFNIGVITPNGTNERTIARDYFAEGPSWSVGGVNLIYQYIYNSVNRHYAFSITNLANGYKLNLQPFGDNRDPSFSRNITNNKVINNQFSLMNENKLLLPLLESEIKQSANSLGIS